MSKYVTASAIAAVLILPLVASADLIVNNGDFSNTSLTGSPFINPSGDTTIVEYSSSSGILGSAWTANGSFTLISGLLTGGGTLPSSGFIDNSGLNSGISIGAYNNQKGSISQYLGSATGDYVLTFYLSAGQAPSTDVPLGLIVKINGVATTESVTPVGPNGLNPWIQYTLDFTASGDTTLEFDFNQNVNPGEFNAPLLDDVSVQALKTSSFAAVPEPSTYAAAGLMLLPLGAALLRTARRKQFAVEKSDS